MKNERRTLGALTVRAEAAVKARKPKKQISAARGDAIGGPADGAMQDLPSP